MNCIRCGRSNPSNAKHCIYCGTLLAVQSDMVNYSDKYKNRKQREAILVILIIILILLLVIVAGVLIYKSNRSRNVSYNDGLGNNSLYASTFSSSEVVTSEQNATYENEDDESSAVESEEMTVPIEIPNQTEEQPDIEDKLTKKDMFLDKADKIEEYSQNYLDTATTQSAINNESAAVYKKWDDLLNEVYQYLKTILTESKFAQLQEDELNWISEKENAVEEAGAEWVGSNMEPMARNMTAIEYTQERCYYLISLIN